MAPRTIGGARSVRRAVAGHAALLVVLGSVLTAVAVTLGSPVADHALVVPWWVLAAMFAGAQSYVLNVQANRETRSVGLTEIPFVVGLVLAAPLSFAVG